MTDPRPQTRTQAGSKAPPAIEIRNYVKKFGDHVAIDRLSLTVEEGEFLSLLGPSGCGKSTILRSIAGFVPADGGQILVAGEEITGKAAHLRPVKMVFQDYALFPHMTIAENIGFGCEMQGMARADIARRVAELLALIRLPEIGRRLPEALSGGQRQRVALARALAPDPGALLLDEPLGALDLKLRRQMQQELKAIQRSTGKTFVFVTHDQEEAMSMSDRIAVMNQGRIEQLGSPEEIWSRPATAFVASFVGAANLLPARVSARSGGMIGIEVLGQSWQLPEDRVTSAAMPAPGETATLVLRPDALEAGPGRPGEDLSLSGQLEERMFFGSRVHLALRCAPGLALQLELPAGDAGAAGLAGAFSAHCRPGRVALVAGAPAGSS